VKNLAIARRYAKALLLIGKEDGQTDTYREELGAFANLSAGKEPSTGAGQSSLRPDDRKKVLTRVMEN
jgi:F-type H+-transporting ATPase subunit delta